MNRRTNALSASILIAVMTAGAAFAVPPGLRRAEPIVCAGNNAVVVRGRLIETAGHGIELSGNCGVEIIDSHIVAGGIGILAHGNGKAVIRNSTIEGGRAALVAQGNGQIRYRATNLRGATGACGNGAIVGDDGAFHTCGGGIRHELQGDLPGIEALEALEALEVLGQSHIDLPGIQVRSGDDTVTIGAGGIVVDDGRDTVTVRPGPGGLRLETDDAALILDADVSVDGDLLRLGLGASVEVLGSWRLAGHSPYRISDTDRLLLELGATDDNGQLRLGLAGDVLFDFDSVAIRPSGAAELSKLAHVLRQRAAGEVRLVGHTDSLGSDDYNRKLSQARAVAVMRWLNSEEGIPAQLMVGQGMGSQKPVAYNTLPDGSDNPAGRAKNRRVEIFLAT